MPAIAWVVMQQVIFRAQGPDSPLRSALGGDLKGKLSPLFYLAGIGLSFVNTAFAGALYVAVALMWLIPDRRVEKKLRA